jgi:hypothetical protein
MPDWPTKEAAAKGLPKAICPLFIQQLGKKLHRERGGIGRNASQKEYESRDGAESTHCMPIGIA